MKSLSDSEAYRDIWLVFMNTKYPGSWIFKEGFRHVYIVERQALGWLCSDPSRSNLFNCILPADYDSDVMGVYAMQNPDATLMHLHVEPHYIAAYPRPGIVSCVSIIQYTLGVHWPTVLTPWQLYNKISNKPPKHIHEVKECQAQNQDEKPGKHQEKLIEQELSLQKETD